MSSSAWMKVIAGTKYWRMSVVSVSSMLIWWRMKVCATIRQGLRPGAAREGGARGTDLMDRDAAAHGGEDAADVVRAEGVCVERTGEVADPEIGDDLVHRHGGSAGPCGSLKA